MKGMKSYHISDVVSKLDMPVKSSGSCESLFDKLGTILKREGYRLVFISRSEHENEEAYRKGERVVILLRKSCVIRTNLPLEELTRFIKSAYFTHEVSGVM